MMEAHPGAEAPMGLSTPDTSTGRKTNTAEVGWTRASDWLHAAH
jgi:hypothetical protein